MSKYYELLPGEKFHQWNFGLMPVCEQLAGWITGSWGDIYEPWTAYIYYQFLKERINDWYEPRLKMCEAFENHLKSLVTATISMYENCKHMPSREEALEAKENRPGWYIKVMEGIERRE